MTDLENTVVETVLDEAKKQLSIKEKIINFLKMLLYVFIFFKWLYVIFIGWFDNVRRATVMQALDKYPESKVWKTILWIKTWRYIYGFIIGLLLSYYYEVDVKFIELINYIKDLINEI